MRLSRIPVGVFWFIMISACGRLTAQVAAPTTPAQVGAPIIQFDNKEFNFGRIAFGEFVKHVYVVTNTGTEVLEISNVRPGCGCTTTGEWSRQIAPGQTGTIPIQFNSSHAYGNNITKTVEVTSNAKNEPKATLFLRGSVWKPLEVAPQTAIINVQSDSTNAASASVRIVNQTDSEVTLSAPTSSSTAFTAEVKTIEPGKKFDLIVTLHPPFAAGIPPATLSLKTSLTNVPTLNVTAIASVQPAVQVSPGQITLAGSPDHWTTNRVLIRGNGNTELALQDPQASDSRLQVKILQLGAHGLYNLLVAVPPDYEIPRGQRVNVTVRTNHPHYPLITIPIAQIPRTRRMAGQYTIPPLVKQTATNGAPPPHP
jgi:hypothetical protein